MLQLCVSLLDLYDLLATRWLPRFESFQHDCRSICVLCLPVLSWIDTRSPNLTDAGCRRVKGLPLMQCSRDQAPSHVMVSSWNQVRGRITSKLWSNASLNG